MNTTRFTVTILGEKNGITRSVIATGEVLRDTVEEAVLSFVNAESETNTFDLSEKDLELRDKLS